uniref:Uncharacterized protein n=1 Tax=Panagrolaimus sp. PS1159 TaxID=55785 RepID=A0AC35FJ78_9BILA
MNFLSMEIKCFNSFKKEKDENLGKCSIFQMCLSLAVETKNMFLLKHLIHKPDDFEDGKKKEIFQNELKIAIKTKFFDGVEYLLNLDEKQTFFRSEFNAIENHENDETPFKLLIEHMPDIANGVLDTLFLHLDKFRYNELNIFNDMCNYGIKYENPPNHNTEEGETRKNEEENLTITENHPINLMIKFERYEMLRHDLIDFYVDAKWNRFARLYHYFGKFNSH